jgi:hypothetical protein
MSTKLKWSVGFLMAFSFLLVSLHLGNRRTFSFSFSSLSPHKMQFDDVVRRDLFSIRSHTIPRKFLSLHQVFWQNHGKSPESKNISPIVADVFRISKNGSYYLQADYFDVDENHGIVQFSFFEKKSRNKVYEISREYSF